MSSFLIEGLLRLVGSEQFQQGLRDTQNQAEAASQRMQKSFDRIATAVKTAFSVTAITGFTRTLVNAAAQVNASNAQFEATFKDVGDAATKAFSDVSKATGVMETRLRVAGTKAFSQFKGAGLDANEALRQTERYLNLAADAAAYYDISLEEADTRLRSFIRGNVEAGDMIGLFTSETQRNARALEDYGKKYIELTENQKQMVMLNISEEIYRQAGALGQASRESGEYANQTGNLAESWLQLKAALGEPIIKELLPIIQGLRVRLGELALGIKDNQTAFSALIDIIETATTAIVAYVAAAKSMEILKSVTSWVRSLTTAQNLLNASMKANVFGLVISVLASLAIAYKNANDSADDLNDITEDLATTSRKYQDAVNALSADTGELSEEERKLYEQRVRLYRLRASEQVLTLASSYDELKDSIADAELQAEGFRGEFDALTLLSTDAIQGDAIVAEIQDARDKLRELNLGSAEYEYYSRYVSALISNARRSSEAITREMESVYSSYVDAEKELVSLNTDAEESILAVAEAVNNGLLNIDAMKLGNNELYTSIMDIVAQLETDVEDKGKDIGKKLSESISNGAKGTPIVLYSDSDEILQSMEKQIRAAEQMKLVFGDAFDLADEKASIYESTLNRLFQNGFGQGSAAVQDIITKLKELGVSMDDAGNSSQDFAQKFMDGFNRVSNFVSEWISPIFDLMQERQTQYLEAEIAGLEEQYDKLQELNEQKLEDKEKSLDEEDEALKDQLYSGQISYADYVEETKKNEQELADFKAQMDEEEAASEQALQAKKDELARKQFESDKANKIAQVWIDAASGIIRAFAENFWGVALGVSALIGGMATAQTMMIQKQEYTPALAKGGIVDEATHALIGEDGAEAIVPLENNTEWVGGLAKAIAPAVAEVQTGSFSSSVREEIVLFRQMVAEFFSWLRAGNREIVIDGQTVARVITPYVDSELGRSSRLKARGI